MDLRRTSPQTVWLIPPYNFDTVPPWAYQGLVEEGLSGVEGMAGPSHGAEVLMNGDRRILWLEVTNAPPERTATSEGPSVDSVLRRVRPEDVAAMSEDELCPICLGTLREASGDVDKVGVCGHAFCAECIRKWLERGRHCPVCKRELLLPTDDAIEEGAMGFVAIAVTADIPYDTEEEEEDEDEGDVAEEEAVRLRHWGALGDDDEDEEEGEEDTLWTTYDPVWDEAATFATLCYGVDE